MGVEQLPNVYKGEPITPYQIKNSDGSITRVESTPQEFTVRWRPMTCIPDEFFRNAQRLVDELATDSLLEHPDKLGRGIVYKTKVENGVMIEGSPYPPITTFSDQTVLEDIQRKDEVEFDTPYGSFHLSHAHGSSVFSPSIVTRVDRPELFANFVANNSLWRIDRPTLIEVLKEVANNLESPRDKEPDLVASRSVYMVGTLKPPTAN